MPLTIGVLRETAPGEKRVAVVPKVLARMNAAGLRVVMEEGAGKAASFADSDYRDIEIQSSPGAVAGMCDALFCVIPRSRWSFMLDTPLRFVVRGRTPAPTFGSRGSTPPLRSRS